MVALDFCDDDYKQNTLNIPEEFSDVDIVDINIEKVYIDKPISAAVFFRMSAWLLLQYNIHDNAIFSFICSTDELPNVNPGALSPQIWRWTLFDRLFHRVKDKGDINLQDIMVGPDDYITYGRAFFRAKHAPIIHIVCAHLQEKQRQYS